MNGWQVARQIKERLRAQTWPDAPGEVAFARGSVLVTAGPTQQALASLIFPFAMVLPLDATADEEERRLLLARFEVRLVTRGAADAFGETVLVGGPRSGGQGTSGGRGLLELEEVLLDAVAELNESDGIRLRLQWQGAVEVIHDESVGYVASRAYQLEAWTTADRSYPPASRLTAVQGAPGEADLAWQLPPSRYDRNALVLRRDAGAVPPASPTAGTNVPVAALATGVTDTPGAGEFSWALFMGYDELRDPPTGAVVNNDRFSAAATVTLTVT